MHAHVACAMGLANFSARTTYKGHSTASSKISVQCWRVRYVRYVWYSTVRTVQGLQIVPIFKLIFDLAI